ncbi:MAG: hypothetical protein HY718_11975 [Planctomycetes bacterium]|nr:hypothetical protein [Planctomycetota bacterium]
MFVEDFGHEAVLIPLLRRLAADRGVQLKLTPRSARGGHGPMLSELEAYLADIRAGREKLPDLFVVGTDANCLGYAERKRQIEQTCREYAPLTVCAIPDPNIERWLLLDSGAFKHVLGGGCSPPDMKCQRDRYKQCLTTAVRAAGVQPLLGGLEYAQDIIERMDLEHVAIADTSLGHLVRDFRLRLNQWEGLSID